MIKKVVFFPGEAGKDNLVEISVSDKLSKSEEVIFNWSTAENRAPSLNVRNNVFPAHTGNDGIPFSELIDVSDDGPLNEINVKLEKFDDSENIGYILHNGEKVDISLVGAIPYIR